MSRAAYDLQVQATAHSASCGHPGFVPDDYLEHLDGLDRRDHDHGGRAVHCGMWERVDGGYRVLDWEAVEVCLDQVARGTARTRRPWPGNANARPRSRPRWPSRSWSLRRARLRNPRQPASSSSPPGTCPPSGSSGPALCRPAFFGNASQDSSICWSKASLLQRLRRPHRRHPGRADRPGVPASAVLRPGPHGRVLRRRRILPGLRRPVLLPALARVRRPDTATAPAATARAWTRTGSHDRPVTISGGRWAPRRGRVTRRHCGPGCDTAGLGSPDLAFARRMMIIDVGQRIRA